MIQLLNSLGILKALPGLPFAGLAYHGFSELAGAAADVTVTLKYPCNFLIHAARISGYSGASIARWRYNGDTGNNYGAVASEPADAAHTATINTSGLLVGETAQTTPRALLVAFSVKETVGRVAKCRGFGIDDTESIGTAVVMTSHGGLWNNTAALFTSVTLNGGAGGNLSAGSWVMVWGARVPPS